MKKLTVLLATLPGAVLAHGGHGPLPVAAHDSFHAAPLIGVGVVAAAIGLAFWRRQG